MPIDSSVFDDEDIFRQEERRILEHSWVFIAHDSEVPDPGDFKRRTIARRPVFVMRGDDGAVRVFVNSCSHRAAMVCKDDTGNAERLQCFYHGWTYDNRGRLVEVPEYSAMPEGFRMEELGLKEMASRCENGSWFGSFTEDAAPLAGPLPSSAASGMAKGNVDANWKHVLASGIAEGFELVFPNLLVRAGELRQVWPLAADLSEVVVWNGALPEAASAGDLPQSFWDRWQDLMAETVPAA